MYRSGKDIIVQVGIAKLWGRLVMNHPMLSPCLSLVGASSEQGLVSSTSLLMRMARRRKEGVCRLSANRAIGILESEMRVSVLEVTSYWDG